ncbi:sce7726 family protein, partial [Leptospira levettii]
DLKIQLLNFLLKKTTKWVFLASEVPFLSMSRFIDLCAGTTRRTYAFEVKSDKDSLVRLNGQLKDMLQSFDYVIVVTTEKHVKNVLKNTPKKVGVYISNGIHLKVLRKPKLNEKLNSISVLSFILKSELIKAYRSLLPNLNINAFEVRKIIAKNINQKEIVKLKRIALKNKYERRTEVFLKEIGNKITGDDLEILRSDFPINLKIAE